MKATATGRAPSLSEHGAAAKMGCHPAVPVAHPSESQWRMPPPPSLLRPPSFLTDGSTSSPVSPFRFLQRCLRIVFLFSFSSRVLSPAFPPSLSFAFLRSLSLCLSVFERFLVSAAALRRCPLSSLYPLQEVDFFLFFSFLLSLSLLCSGRKGGAVTVIVSASSHLKGAEEGKGHPHLR